MVKATAPLATWTWTSTRARLDAFERHRGYARDHAAPRPVATAAG